MPVVLQAQQPADKEKPTKQDSKPAADKPKAKTDGAGDAKGAVHDGERLSFDQSKVSAEMNELEDRMFRLAEALKALEPENSSRLMIALKNAREELILHQMKGTEDLLKKLELNEALGEEKQLLTKLQRLHELLMSMDLDFQRRLEQLRLIRDILRRLDGAIKEEDREQKLSSDAAQLQKDVDKLKKRQATLEELVKRQTSHVDDGKSLAKLDRLGDAGQRAIAQLGKDQAGTRGDTKSLAESDGNNAPSEHLNTAESEMGEAATPLDKQQAADAVPHQEKALDELKKELGRTVEELKRREEQLDKEKFAEMKKDQEGNHKQSDSIADSVRKLGESGASALNSMTSAGSSMNSAEGHLDQQEADPASGDQDSASKSLKAAKDDLLSQQQQLLEQLRGEVRRRVLEALTIMLEKQTAVRASTETLSPKAKAGAREALTAVTGLSKSEGRIIDVANEILTLVEETEFGIALPAALRVVRHSMTGVKGALGKGDASEPVITTEKEIEEDLKTLLAAMKQMPAKGSPSDKAQRNSPRERERELNRLIAELKMIRMLQVRVNSETLNVDGKRIKDDADLSSAIKKAITAVEEHQDDVLEATTKLLDERSDELGQIQ